MKRSVTNTDGARSAPDRRGPLCGRHPGAARERPWRRRGFLPLAALLACAVLATPHPASAHARLTRSQPAEGQALERSPAAIDLWFNEILDLEFNGIDLFPAADEQSAQGNLISAKPSVDPSDRTHLSIPLPPLAPGAYVVHWKVLSRDGHSARGRIVFRVGAAAAVAPQSSAPGADARSDASRRDASAGDGAR
jgi:methionine-rich copper-binding protein CopC